MDFKLTRLPKKISPCSIVEAIVEIRFESKNNIEELLVKVGGALSSKYSNIIPLSVMDIPAVYRDSDPSLKFSPYYRMTSKDDSFVVQFGPRCFSITSPKEYHGWTRYFEELKWVFEKISDLGIIENTVRLGVRYINFFENYNIFEKIKIQLKLSDNSLISCDNFLKSDFDYDKFRCSLQLSNTALLSDKNVKGSSIDVDMIFNGTFADNKYVTIIEEAHTLEKKIFFNILKDDFLAQLNPEY